MPNIKEDLQLIAALTANTAGFIKNNINGMIVGDGNNLKSDIKVQDVIQKATKELANEYNVARVPQQAASQPSQPPTPSPRIVKTDVLTAPPIQPQLELGIEPQYREYKQPQVNNQLEFNFDNSPTAQNIYYKLNTIIESIDKLDKRVNALSEHIIKKKLDKKKKGV